MTFHQTTMWPRGEAEVCKTLYGGSNPPMVSLKIIYMKVFSVVILITILCGSFTPTPKNIFVISGKVISFEESFPIEGAAVVVKGSKNSTGTQVDGTFSLTLQPIDTVIIISNEGYITQDVKINPATRDYNIVLRRSGNQN